MLTCAGSAGLILRPEGSRGGGELGMGNSNVLAHATPSMVEAECKRLRLGGGLPPRRRRRRRGGASIRPYWHQWDYTGQAVRIAPIDPPLGAVQPWALTKVAGDKLPGSASPAPLMVEVLN